MVAPDGLPRKRTIRFIFCRYDLISDGSATRGSVRVLSKPRPDLSATAHRRTKEAEDVEDEQHWLVGTLKVMSEFLDGSHHSVRLSYVLEQS